MASSESLAGRIRERLSGLEGIEEKRMFGGLAFLLKGSLCVGVRKGSLLVRLGPAGGEEALRRSVVTEFAVAGRTTKGRVVVAPEGIEGDGRLGEWIERTGMFVSGLPAK